MIETHLRSALPIGLLLAALTAGCGGDVVLPDEGEAADLQIVSGQDQRGLVGATLANQIVVRVLDTRERPVVNHDVTFSIGSGGGSVEPATVKSDAAGRAATSWTLGPATGSHLLRVQSPRGGSGVLELTVSAIAFAGRGSVLVGFDGDDQSGPVRSALADSLVVKATDALGNPVADVEVTWSVSGGGSISPTTVLTDANGLAAAERVLGPTAGPQSARATVEQFTGSPVTFSHTAVPANPTQLVLVSGDGQRAPGGFEVSKDLVVRLEDENRNGIGERPISWVVPAGSGSVNPVSTTTDANGLATTRWTLPPAAGDYHVSAVFSGLPAVTFTGTATADEPTTIALASGNNQSAMVGGELPNPLVVRVTDASGNPVENVGVAWTAEDGGTVSEPNTATDGAGLARVTRTLGLVPGSYSTMAAVEGLTGSPITFTSTATVGPPAKLAIVTQPGSPTISGNAFSPAPVIQVQDALGNPVSQGGIEVTATITSGQAGASLLNFERNTSSSGRATFTNLRITGPPDNDYVLTFTAGLLTPVSSVDLTVNAGGASRIVIRQQPSASAQSGQEFAQQPVVEVVDATGNPVSGSRTIQVELGDGAGDGTLTGDLTVSTGGGSTATFTDLGITGEARDYTLIFRSGTLAPDESDAITITAVPPTTTTLSAEPTSSVVGQEVTFTAQVTSTAGTPTGQVSFRDNGTEIGQGTLSGGVATFATDELSEGTHQIRAHYLGSGAFPASASSVLNYQVSAGNVPPSAQDDAFNVNEDETLNVSSPGVLGNDDDPDGDDEDLSAVLISGPAQDPDFTLNSDGSFTYTPNPDFSGSDSFTYQAVDAEDNSNTATVTITVTPANDPPSFQAGGNQAASAVSGAVSVPGWATAISPGPNEASQTVSFQVNTNNDDAFDALPTVDPSGTLGYTPDPTFSPLPVDVTVTVVALDNAGGTSASHDFTITINP